MRVRLIVVLACCAVIASHLAGQDRLSLRTRLLSFSPLPDTTLSVSSDSLAPSGTRSPALATVMSAVLPGSGQIYAGRYWTIPLIWGFGYWFARNYIQLDRKYDEWAANYRRSLEQGPPGGLGDRYARDLRDFYRDERDRFAFYLAITYVLNIVDAYVGASLYSFDVGEDLDGGASVRAEIRLVLR